MQVTSTQSSPKPETSDASPAETVQEFGDAIHSAAGDVAARGQEVVGKAVDAAQDAGQAGQAKAGELVSQGAQAVQDTAAATAQVAQVAQDAASAFEPTFDVSGSVGTKYGSEEISFNRTWLEGKRGVPDHKSTTPDYMLQHKTQDSSYAPGLSVSVGVKPVAPEGEHADNPFAQAMAGVGFKGIKASADVSADTASKNNRVAQLDLSTGEMKNKTFDSGATVSGSVSIAADFAGPSGSYSAKVTPIDAALYKSGSYDVTSSAKLSRSSPHNPKLGASVDLANDKTSLSGTVPGGQKVAQELTAGVLGRNALDEQGGVNWEQAVPMAGDKAAQFGMNTLVQLPGLGVKALAEGGRHLAEGSEAAAREILKTGAYAAGNLGHQARNGLGAEGGHEAGLETMQAAGDRMEAQDRAQIDAGDVFGKVSEAADGFNAGAVRVVEATAGTTVNIARAAAGGENIFAMDPQQLDDGGYTAFKNTQAQFSEASKDLRADPPFAMPSLPSSTEEALARMTPQ